MLVNRNFASGGNGLYAVIIHGGTLDRRQYVFSTEGCVATEAECFRLSLWQTEINIETVVPDIKVVCVRQRDVAGEAFVDDFKTGRKQASESKGIIVACDAGVFHGDFDGEVFALFEVTDVNRGALSIVVADAHGEG